MCVCVCVRNGTETLDPSIEKRRIELNRLKSERRLVIYIL